MRKVLLVVFCIILVLTVSAQKVYFIYIQSEKDQPFYVKMNNKFFSSASSGYLILSKLLDSTYKFSIGTVQNKWPEQNFEVAIDKKDHGYLFKNFGEKGWGLFDLQTLAVNMASLKNNEAALKTDDKNVSKFTDILSKAADDPTLKEKPVQPVKEEEKAIINTKNEIVKKNEPKSNEKESQSKKKNEDAGLVQTKINGEKPVDKVSPKQGQVLTAGKSEESKLKTEKARGELQQTVYNSSVVTRKYETSTTEGFGLVFIDDFKNGTKDTISIMIPEPEKTDIVTKEKPKEELRFLEINTPVQEAAESGKKENIAEDSVASNSKPNPAKKCLNVADETDFYILRKRMASSVSDKEMLNEADEYFKLKCFSTEQIKNLSTLFLKEEGKFNFLEVAYPFVSDANNFSSLGTEFKTENYLNKFKSMIRN